MIVELDVRPICWVVNPSFPYLYKIQIRRLPPASVLPLLALQRSHLPPAQLLFSLPQPLPTGHLGSIKMAVRAITGIFTQQSRRWILAKWPPSSVRWKNYFVFYL